MSTTAICPALTRASIMRRAGTSGTSSTCSRRSSATTVTSACCSRAGSSTVTTTTASAGLSRATIPRGTDRARACGSSASTPRGVPRELRLVPRVRVRARLRDGAALAPRDRGGRLGGEARLDHPRGDAARLPRGDGCARGPDARRVCRARERQARVDAGPHPARAPRRAHRPRRPLGHGAGGGDPAQPPRRRGRRGARGDRGRVRRLRSAKARRSSIRSPGSRRRPRRGRDRDRRRLPAGLLSRHLGLTRVEAARTSRGAEEASTLPGGQSMRRSRAFSILTIVAAAFVAASPALAEPSAIPHRLVPNTLSSGERSNPTGAETVVFSTVVEVPDAPWVRLTFRRVELGDDSYLRVTSLADGAVQTLGPRVLAQWRNTSAYFNGSSVRVELVAAPLAQALSVDIGDVIAGVAPSNPESQCGPTDDRVPSSLASRGRL